MVTDILTGVLGIGTSNSAHALEIAILKSADITAYDQAVAAFKNDLPSTVTTLTEYNLQGNISQGRKFARKLRASNAQLVLAVGLKAALVAKLEILDIPVIFCMVLNPGRYDLFGSNMTGIELQIPVAHQLRTIHDSFPGITRLGVMYDPTKTGAPVKEASVEVKKYGLELIARAVREEKEVPSTLREIVNSIDALWLLPDSTVLTEESLDFLVSTTLETNVPLIGFSSGLARSGALMGIYIKYEDVGTQAALLAKKTLNGEIIPTGVIVPVDKTRISLNLKTANFLNILILPEVIMQADEVY